MTDRQLARWTAVLDDAVERLDALADLAYHAERCTEGPLRGAFLDVSARLNMLLHEIYEERVSPAEGVVTFERRAVS